MSLTLYIVFSAMVVVLAAVVTLRRAQSAGRRPKKRGTAPGQGDSLVNSAYPTTASHAAAARVSRDPQEYARGFAPPKTRQD